MRYSFVTLYRINLISYSYGNDFGLLGSENAAVVVVGLCVLANSVDNLYAAENLSESGIVTV